MKLKPGFEVEYKKRHAEIWTELEELLRKAGIKEYFIWLDEETNILFAYQKLEDNAKTSDLPGHPVMQKWWKYMADLMDTNEDFSPVVVSLKEMFKL